MNNELKKRINDLVFQLRLDMQAEEYIKELTHYAYLNGKQEAVEQMSEIVKETIYE